MNFTRKQLEKLCQDMSSELNDIVFNNINNYLVEHPEERGFLNPAFPFPQTVRIGVLKDYLVVEYIGPNNEEEDSFQTKLIHEPDQDLYDFLGIDLEHLNSPRIPFDESIQNMNFFLGESIEYLTDYFYDFTQQPEDFCINGFIDISQASRPCVINNCTFFWSDKEERLKIKHIDLLELFPHGEEGVLYHDKKSLLYFSNYIIYNKAPKYNVELHRVLNEFIQLVNTKPRETTITNYLEENPLILQISFGFHDLNPQKILKWQYKTDRKDLKPDFLPTRMDGFCDIVEFKLPYIKSTPLVGGENRKHPSYEIDKAIAQAEEYEAYMQQEVNRDWVQKTFEIKVLHPMKYIIIGHSNEFSAEERRKLRKTRDTVFFTYDEFIEMARYQIYRMQSSI